MTDWRERAACIDVHPDVFFPDDYRLTKVVAQAKAHCAACPVREQCLAEHIEERDGVFGGTTPEERRDLRRTMPRPARPPIRHGTHTGYKQHLRRGEKACAACLIANTAYSVERKRYLRLVGEGAA